jgi:ATP-binding cassette subfamily B protein
MTAVIGITGSGKTTLMNLIPRLYDVTEGEIRIAGVDVRQMSSREIEKRIAVIPQQAFLFSGTIADNVRYGNPEATDAEVWRAIEIAQAKAFVSAMPDGIESFVSQAGKNYSGGQKQRLAIARAILKQAPIYIFDDSFSALDFLTEAKVRTALNEQLAGRTRIVITQRVVSAMHSDRIFVLSDGRLVGAGPHEELLGTCPIYREIFLSQTGGGAV